jgi:hypothetical protein
VLVEKKVRTRRGWDKREVKTRGQNKIKRNVEWLKKRRAVVVQK